MNGPFPTEPLDETNNITFLPGAGFITTLFTAVRAALNVKLVSLNVSASNKKLTVPLPH